MLEQAAVSNKSHDLRPGFKQNQVYGVSRMKIYLDHFNLKNKYYGI